MLDVNSLIKPRIMSSVHFEDLFNILEENITVDNKINESINLHGIDSE